LIAWLLAQTSSGESSVLRTLPRWGLN